MDRDLLIRFEVPYSQKEAKGATMSRVQEANCNSWLDMRVVRDGVFQTVVSVAYSEGKVVRAMVEDMSSWHPYAPCYTSTEPPIMKGDQTGLLGWNVRSQLYWC